MFLGHRWFRIIRSMLSKGYQQVDLQLILTGANPQAPLSERVEWLDGLLEWIRLPIHPSETKKQKNIKTSRLIFLLNFLDRFPNYRPRVANTLQSILLESDATYFFAECGLESHLGFVKELSDRFVQNFIPSFREPKNLKQTFENIFVNEEDIIWFKSLDDETQSRLMALVTPEAELQDQLTNTTQQSIYIALNLLALRLANLSIDREMRARLPEVILTDSPFFQLLLHFSKTANIDDLDRAKISRTLSLIDQCILYINAVYPHLESSGVSIDLVYKLDKSKSLLRRIQRLMALSHALRSPGSSQTTLFSFISSVARQNERRSSLSSFLGSNINLIARKIIERTSETGEHYITRNRAEYTYMFFSAAGGGLVTVFTTFIKAVITKMGMPLFFEGLFIGFNYSISFLVIQLSHFTLATKTPAMTASTLATKLKNLSTTADADAFVEDVVCMARSAFIGVVGNVGLVIPGCFLFDTFFNRAFGHHVFDNAHAIEQLEAHNPLTSLSLVYAILTGFILWSSSIIGGWVENWFVYRKQFEIFAESNYIRRAMGRFMQLQLATFFRKNLAGFATSISLGFMLAFSGIWGKFFGLPLQVRHVTLSSGTLSFSLLGLTNMKENLHLIIGAAIGILCIAVLNFGTSFTLSLFVAARARDIQLSRFPYLFRLIGRRFLATPLDFFRPKKQKQNPT
jgi:site-specific recombinase